MPKCIICGKNYKGYGNNARPINNGQCCDKCNYLNVIPARMGIIFENKGTKKDRKGW